MGWVWLAVIGGVAFGALHLAGVPRVFGWFTGAALMLGAAGYALQGRPTLPGHPVRPDIAAVTIDPGLVAFRTAIMPGTGDDTAVLAAADDRLRAGDPVGASRGLLAALAKRPGDAALWTGLGGALAAHDGGQVSPAARFAFARALSVAPAQPGPPFFLGMAFAEAGQLPAAKEAWLRALRLTPQAAPYRLDIAERLALIDEVQRMNAGTPPPR